MYRSMLMHFEDVGAILGSIRAVLTMLSVSYSVKTNRQNSIGKTK